MTMPITIDTSAYSAFEREHQDIRQLLERADEVWLSAIVLGELHSGFLGGSRLQFNRSRLAAFLSRPGVHVGVLDQTTSERYAEILQHLRSAGSPLPTNDIWIAAHAMQHGLQVVTLDKHFSQMPQVSLLMFEK